MTPPELRLWLALRRKSHAGLRFRRQHPVGPYILDFYCPAAHLAVEVDGDTHNYRDDTGRDRCLKGRGIRVLRIPAADLRDRLDDVMDAIAVAAGVEAGR
jgi:very-short-patch-repair endonuclease